MFCSTTVLRDSWAIVISSVFPLTFSIVLISEFASHFAPCRYMGRLINRSSLRSLESLFRKFYPHLLQSDEPTGSPLPSESRGGTPSVQHLLERAVVEHNMLAASLIYNNISLENLGALLEISTAEVSDASSRKWCSCRGIWFHCHQITWLMNDQVVAIRIPVRTEHEVCVRCFNELFSLPFALHRMVFYIKGQSEHDYRWMINKKEETSTQQCGCTIW